jgi:hypothetical protein
MAPLWIETKDYVGRNRRWRRQAFRFLDRRRGESAGRQPALATMLRQLRAADLASTSDRERRVFRQRLGAAASLAARTGEAECAAELAGLMQAFDRAPHKRAIAVLSNERLDRLLARLR